MSDTFRSHSAARRRYAPPGFRVRLAVHVRRALGRDPNPICRPVDRLRSRLVVGACLVMLLAGAFCWYPALLVQRHEAAAAARLAAHRHLVSASVLAASTAATDPQPFGGSGYDTRLGWSYPTGHRHDTVVTTQGTLPKTARVPLWVDDSGAPAVAPRSRGEIAMDAAWAGLTALVGETALVLVGTSLLDRALGRRAQRAWERDWAAVEPTWSGRTG